MNEAPVTSKSTNAARIYRGVDVESLLPRIREDLGPDALITCQRSGLTGGVAGFFQRPCVELEAVPGSTLALGPDGILAGGDDDYEPMLPVPASALAAAAAAAATTPDTLPAPAAEPAMSGLPERFAGALADAERAIAPPAPDPATSLPRAAATVADELVMHGIDEPLAAELVSAAALHSAPFAPSRRLKSLVRAALARRIPIAEAPARTARRIAFVGPRGAGKTLCAERFAATYAAAGHPAVTCLALRPADDAAALRGRVVASGAAFAIGAGAAEAQAQLAAAGDGAVTVIDTPGTSVRDAKGIAALGRELRSIGADEVQLVLPATIGLAAAEELVAAHAALTPTALVVSHADATSQIGSLVTLAIRHGLPISFVSHDPASADGLAAADGVVLAGRLLP